MRAVSLRGGLCWSSLKVDGVVVGMVFGGMFMCV